MDRENTIDAVRTPRHVSGHRSSVPLPPASFFRPARARPRRRTLLLALTLLSTACAGTCSAAGTTSPVVAAWSDPARGLPMLTAFDVAPVRAKGAVWAFAPSSDGRLWIGSDQLLQFDGRTTEAIETPATAYAFRGLAPDPAGRLWVGAVGAIGRLDPDGKGGWTYVSMARELAVAGIADLNDVWAAHATPEGVAFVTDQRVLRWDGTHFESWRLPSTPRLVPCRDRNTLWIYQHGKGLLRLEPTGPRLVFAAEELPATPVVWVATPAVGSGDTGDALLLGSSNAVFVRRGAEWQKLEDVSAAVSGKLPLCAVMLAPDTLAIGTFLSGIVIASLDDRVLATIDRAAGLPNENIHALWADGDRHLWAGYEGGMARIDARGTLSVFDARNGLLDTHTQSVLAHDGALYAHTHKALYRVHAPGGGRPAQMQPAASLQAYLWDAASIGPHLWVSGFGGLWRMTADGAVHEHGVSADVFHAQPAGVHPSALYFIEGFRLKALVPSPYGGWVSRDFAVNLGDTPLSFVRDPKGDLWISTIVNGVFRFRLETMPNGMTRLRLVRQYREGAGLPQPAARPELTVLGGRVYAFTANRILETKDDHAPFTPVPGLEGFMGIAASTTDDAAVGYWLARSSALEAAAAPVLLRVHAATETSPLTWDPVELPALEASARPSNLSFTPGPDGSGALWFGGSQSLLRLDAAAATVAAAPPAMTLRRVLRDDEPLSLPAAGSVFHFEPGAKRLRIELGGALRANGESAHVQYALEGFGGGWSTPQREPVFEFTGLRAGDYVFRARAVDRFGRTGAETRLAFALAAPWYFRPLALVAYTAAALLLVFATVRWRLRHLERQNERLNRLVEERTQELALANAAKNEFLENISHEIRNPLNGITGLVDLLKDANLPLEEKRLARSLRACTESLARVFEDVLGFSKLEYGYVAIEERVFSLRRMLEEIVALLAVPANQQATPVSIRLPDDGADGFRADDGKIKTIVTNFVSNALKYAPGALVEISARWIPDEPAAGDAARGELRIEVRDQGPGISREEQAVIFKKFVRGSRAKENGTPGTGLGLASCRMLAELLDGKIGVTSRRGDGATFWVRLPVHRATIAATPAEKSPVPLPRPTAGRALIVEDQDYNQTVLRGIALQLGYAVDIASHAGEVWPLIEPQRYDVVFLDWELPGMKGGDIARRLRQHRHTRDAVIIATTAHDSEQIRRRCLDAGMDGFALKPFGVARMRALVAEAAARRTGRTPVTPVEAASELAFPGPADAGGISLDVFSDFAAGDPTHAHEAVNRYLATLDEELTALADAMDTHDAERVMRQAHRLRSHAGLVNGVALNRAAQRLQDAARRESPDTIAAGYREVVAEAAALKTAIAERAKKPAAPA